MKTNENGNLITIESPEQYARIYTRIIDISADEHQAGWVHHASAEEDLTKVRKFFGDKQYNEALK